MSFTVKDKYKIFPRASSFSVTTLHHSSLAKTEELQTRAGSFYSHFSPVFDLGSDIVPLYGQIILLN